jgi:hypothetical protein
MARRPKGELSHVKGKGYRICVGKRLGDDGKLRPASFWLGHDIEVARVKADSYLKAWNETHRPDGEPWTVDSRRPGEPWTAESIRLTNEWIAQRLAAHKRFQVWIDDQSRRAEPLRSLAYPGTAPASPTPARVADPVAVEAKAAPAMLHAALDAYAAAVGAKALSTSYRRRIAETISDLKAFRPDVPLTTVDRVWLEQLTDWIKSRPLSAKKNKATGKREPIKPATVATYCQHWKQAFGWIDHASDSDRFGRWEAPKRMADLFAVDVTKLMTKVERDRAADGPDQLTVPEIVSLYRGAAEYDLHKIIVLMGLFTAQGQAELACTRRDEFDLDAAKFVHRRSKTGQRGEYWLPPELTGMLRTYFAAVEPIGDGLAFSTRTGAVLVVDKNDAIGQMFAELRDRAKITRPGVTFYACRRFLADRAARAGGDSLRDTALAHTPKTVGGRHYSNFRDFAALEKVSRELHAELVAAGMFVVPAKVEGKAKGGRPKATMSPVA